MPHFNILLQLISLFAGFAAAIYINYKWKYCGHEFLRWLLLSVICINFWIVINLTSKYVNINIFEGVITEPGFSWGMIFRHPLSTLTIIFLTIFFLEFLRALTSAKLFSKFIHFFKIFSTAVLINYTAAIFYYIFTLGHDWLVISDIYINRISILVLYLGMFYSLVNQNAKLVPQNKIRLLITSYLIGYFGFVLMFVSLPIKVTFMSLLFIALNIIPLLWVRSINEYINRTAAKSKNVVETINSIGENFSLSEREMEIFNLLIEGKSNKEIEDTLFISLNTVRNHIHNIYKKLNIGSRGQLMQFVVKELKTE